MALKNDITVDQGSTFVKDFVIRTGDNNPLDLTGYTARLQVRDTYDTATTRLNLTTASGKLSITAVEGKVTLTLVPGDTSSIKFTGDKLKGRYDLEIESAQGVVIRVVEGNFTISREITR